MRNPQLLFPYYILWPPKAHHRAWVLTVQLTQLVQFYQEWHLISKHCFRGHTQDNVMRRKDFNEPGFRSRSSRTILQPTGLLSKFVVVSMSLLLNTFPTILPWCVLSLLPLPHIHIHTYNESMFLFVSEKQQGGRESLTDWSACRRSGFYQGTLYNPLNTTRNDPWSSSGVALAPPPTTSLQK